MDEYYLTLSLLNNLNDEMHTRADKKKLCKNKKNIHKIYMNIFINDIKCALNEWIKI